MVGCVHQVLESCPLFGDQDSVGVPACRQVLQAGRVLPACRQDLQAGRVRGVLYSLEQLVRLG